MFKNLPEVPGVYIFKNKTGKIIYIGKAKNLKSRIKSYKAITLAPKTAKMMSESTKLSYIKVDSEFEALLLEAKLIKKYQPKWNSVLKDGKSPLYIGITKSELPIIKTFRQTDLNKTKLKLIWGPFINENTARQVLRNLKKAFPFCDHKPSRRPCINNEIGLCNPCSSEIKNSPELKKEYLLNIRRIKSILNGNIKQVEKKLEEDMKIFSKEENYEEANIVFSKIKQLDYITHKRTDSKSYVNDPNLLEDIREQELLELKKIINNYIYIKKITRIECYDIAHISGSFPTASMITFINGDPDKKYYRHFKVLGKGNSDTDSLKQILLRRKKYFKTWGKPDLIIIDGGKPQVSAVQDVIKNILVIGIAKREETLIFKINNIFINHKLKKTPALYLVQRLRNEAHRFARRYHHQLISKSISQK